MSISQLGRVLIIIPTYNEIGNIKAITSSIRSLIPQVDILIADDNSPDGTGLLADQLAAADNNIKVKHRLAKTGLGTAYLDAFGWARAQGYQVVVEMDADGSHRAQDLQKILFSLIYNDVVLGSRWVSGGSVVNWPLHRKLLSRFGNVYTRLWLDIPIKDATGGFRAYRMSALDRINISQISSQGYCFQVDMAWRAIKTGLRVIEVPITFVEREIGESKMSTDIVKEAFLRVTQWGLAKRFGWLTRLFRTTN